MPCRSPAGEAFVRSPDNALTTGAYGAACRHRDGRSRPLRSEVVTVRQGQELPDSWHACVLLGDTSPAHAPAAMSWRAEIVSLLRQRWSVDGRLVVLLQEPTPDMTRPAGDRYGSGGWPQRAVDIADAAAYWWPAGTDPRLMSATMAAWHDSHRVVCGASPDLTQAARLVDSADRSQLSSATSLPEMAAAISELIGAGAPRVGGERDVPLFVWNTESFQRWYTAQTAAGNKLIGARLVWTFCIGDNAPFPLYWALHVRIHVAFEDRVKANEVVLSRPDISVMTLYHPGATVDDTIIVLIREFRGPASTPDGLVHELPGGSGAEDNELDQAISEVEEEVGLAIEADRVRAYGSRQIAATVSAHQAYLFAAEITDEELSLLRSLQSLPHGRASDTEQTWTEITTFREIRRSRLVDWATIGMISEILLDRYGDSAG